MPVAHNYPKLSSVVTVADSLLGHWGVSLGACRLGKSFVYLSSGYIPASLPALPVRPLQCNKGSHRVFETHRTEMFQSATLLCRVLMDFCVLFAQEMVS